jgi:putative lipase involved disintegration of autophagic bodies
MFKFIKSKSYKNIKESRDKANDERSKALADLKQAQDKLDHLLEENEELSSEVKKLNDLFNNSSEISVKLDIDSDLKKVTPTIKYNEDVFEKLVELGYLNDGQQGHTFSIQLALVVVASEALNQIIDTYQTDIDEE